MSPNAADIGHGVDVLSVRPGGLHDRGSWEAELVIRKWDPDQVIYARRKTGLFAPTQNELAAVVAPYEVTEPCSNLLLTAGLDWLTKRLLGSGTALGATTARLGVGDTNTAPAIGQTDLAAAAGSTHRWFQIMDASFPTQANGLMTFHATLASGDGNFAAGTVEWGIDVGTATVTSGNTVSATGPLINRGIGVFGTKVSGAVWGLVATITIS